MKPASTKQRFARKLFSKHHRLIKIVHSMQNPIQSALETLLSTGQTLNTIVTDVSVRYRMKTKDLHKRSWELVREIKVASLDSLANSPSNGLLFTKRECFWDNSLASLCFFPTSCTSMNLTWIWFFVSLSRSVYVIKRFVNDTVAKWPISCYPSQGCLYSSIYRPVTVCFALPTSLYSVHLLFVWTLHPICIGSWKRSFVF